MPGSPVGVHAMATVTVALRRAAVVTASAQLHYPPPGIDLHRPVSDVAPSRPSEIAIGTVRRRCVEHDG
jgi:hypothetical protein